MYNKTANKTKMEMLQKEYLAAHDEITKKKCFCRGIMKEMEQTLEAFYRGYNGKFYKMCLDENGKMIDETRISSVEIRYDFDIIDIKIRLAGCPIACGYVDLTKKEQELISKAQKIWNMNKNLDWFDNAKDYEKLGMELYALKNNICIFDVVHLFVYEETIYVGQNPCDDYLNISNREGQVVYLRDFYTRSIYNISTKN